MGFTGHGHKAVRADGDKRLEFHQHAHIRDSFGNAPAARQILQRIQTGENAHARHKQAKRLGDFLRGFAACIAHAAGFLHQQALANRCGERIHQRDVQVFRHTDGDQRALQRAGKRGGNQHAQHAVARGFCSFKFAKKGVRRGLGGLGRLPGFHPLPEDFLRQIHAVSVGVAAESDGHRHAANVELLQLLLREIGGGIGKNANHSV